MQYVKEIKANDLDTTVTLDSSDSDSESDQELIRKKLAIFEQKSLKDGEEVEPDDQLYKGYLEWKEDTLANNRVKTKLSTEIKLYKEVKNSDIYGYIVFDEYNIIQGAREIREWKNMDKEICKSMSYLPISKDNKNQKQGSIDNTRHTYQYQ